MFNETDMIDQVVHPCSQGRLNWKQWVTAVVDSEDPAGCCINGIGHLRVDCLEPGIPYTRTSYLSIMLYRNYFQRLIVIWLSS